MWWAWGDHVQVAVRSVGTATSGDGSVVPDGLARVVDIQAVADVCWDTGVDSDVGGSQVGSDGGAVSLAVLFSSGVEDRFSRKIVRVSSDVAEVSISVWLAWWSDGWIEASIAVTAASLKSLFLLVASVGGVHGSADVRWIAGVEGSSGDDSIQCGVQVDGNTVSLAGSPSSIRNLASSDENSRVASTWHLIWSNWWDVGDVGSNQVTVVKDITARGSHESVQVESVVRVVESEGTAHGSWCAVECSDKTRSNDGGDSSAVSIADDLGSNVNNSVSGVESDVALECLSWNAIVGWVDTLVGVAAASGQRVVNGRAVVAESHGSASAAGVTGVEGGIVGHVVDGSSEGNRHTLSVAHTVVWLADVLSVEVDSFVADNSWVFAGWDGGDVDSGWGKAVVRVRTAASGDSWISSWDLSAVSIVSSESKSEVATHSNWGTVVDSSVLSVDNRVQGSAPSVTELVSSSVVVVLWNGDSRVATKLWTLTPSVWINAEIVVAAASVDSSEDGSARV